MWVSLLRELMIFLTITLTAEKFCCQKKFELDWCLSDSQNYQLIKPKILSGEALRLDELNE